jgi:hypothetical protein
MEFVCAAQLRFCSGSPLWPRDSPRPFHAGLYHSHLFALLELAPPHASATAAAIGLPSSCCGACTHRLQRAEGAHGISIHRLTALDTHRAE